MNSLPSQILERWLKAMRLLLLIISFFFSCLSFGQDSLQVDTTVKNLTFAVQDSVIVDSASSAIKVITVKKKRQTKKAKKLNVKDKPVVNKALETKNIDSSSNNNRPIIIVVVAIVLISVLAYSGSFFGSIYKNRTTSSKNDGSISDYLGRILLSRRDYYRNIYLKSEAWKRKRYLVLKRDNWRCVYCGGKATQVHHTRYAKINIGKEPIEWLVSICKTCHDSKHN